MLSQSRIRRVLTLLVTVALAGSLAGALPASPAAAQEDCWFETRTLPDGSEMLVWTCGRDWQGGSGGDRVCQVSFRGDTWGVPCVEDTYGWFTTIQGGCYIKPKNPQPPADDDIWDGHDPTEGIIYLAHCFALEGADQLGLRSPFDMFLDAGEGFVGDLLEQAIALLPMEGPDIQIAPDPSGVGLVGLPVWMWTEQTPETWGPLDASLESLGHVMDVTANAEQISWGMGDGAERVCTGPGTPYEPEFGADPSPDCGHTYALPSRNLPDGRYTVTATTEWHIDWQIAGTAITGTEIRTRESSTSVRINELQVVTS